MFKDDRFEEEDDFPRPPQPFKPRERKPFYVTPEEIEEAAKKLEQGGKGER